MRRHPRGQAAVELLALLPALALAALVAWQMVVAGHVLTVAGAAARTGVRAAEVGAPAGPAALAALPARYARSGAVVALDDAPAGPRVRVRLAFPGLVPGLPEPGDVVLEAGTDAAVAALWR